VDIGTKKKGEKIDYVIKKDGEPILIIECKNGMKMLMLIISNCIDIIMFQNLAFGVLTNGHIYNFYADLEKPNIMDESYFTLDISDLKETSFKDFTKFFQKTVIILKKFRLCRRTKIYKSN
jgi:hypothetical protein